MSRKDIILGFFGFLCCLIGSIAGYNDTEDAIFVIGIFMSAILTPIFGIMWINDGVERYKQRQIVSEAKFKKSKMCVLMFLGTLNKYCTFKNYVLEVHNCDDRVIKYTTFIGDRYNSVNDHIGTFHYTCEGFIGKGEKGQFAVTITDKLTNCLKINEVAVEYEDGGVATFDAKDVQFGTLNFSSVVQDL